MHMVMLNIYTPNTHATNKTGLLVYIDIEKVWMIWFRCPFRLYVSVYYPNTVKNQWTVFSLAKRYRYFACI